MEAALKVRIGNFKPGTKGQVQLNELREKDQKHGFIPDYWFKPSDSKETIGVAKEEVRLHP